MLTNLEQSQRLKKIGFNEPCLYFRNGYKDYQALQVNGTGFNLNDYNSIAGCISTPSLSEALDWLRKNKGIFCAVSLYFNDRFKYQGEYSIGNNDKVTTTKPFGLFEDAESALLDLVLTFLESE